MYDSFAKEFQKLLFLASPFPLQRRGDIGVFEIPLSLCKIVVHHKLGEQGSFASSDLWMRKRARDCSGKPELRWMCDGRTWNEKPGGLAFGLAMPPRIIKIGTTPQTPGQTHLNKKSFEIHPVRFIN